MKWCGLCLTPKFKPSALSNPNKIFCGTNVRRANTIEAAGSGRTFPSCWSSNDLSCAWQTFKNFMDWHGFAVRDYHLLHDGHDYTAIWAKMGLTDCRQELGSKPKAYLAVRPFRGDFRGNWHVPPCHSNNVILTSPHSVDAFRQSL